MGKQKPCPQEATGLKRETSQGQSKGTSPLLKVKVRREHVEGAGASLTASGQGVCEDGVTEDWFLGPGMGGGCRHPYAMACVKTEV